MGYKKLILVADDEEDLRKVLSIRLFDAGYEVLEADTGREALRIAKEKRPNLIIMDIMMPGMMDGMATSQQLKEDVLTKDIPVIFLTGLQDKLTEPSDHKSGDNIIFAKPYDAKELLTAVKRLVD